MTWASSLSSEPFPAPSPGVFTGAPDHISRPLCCSLCPECPSYSSLLADSYLSFKSCTCSKNPFLDSQVQVRCPSTVLPSCPLLSLL